MNDCVRVWVDDQVIANHFPIYIFIVVVAAVAAAAAAANTLTQN